MFKYFAIQLEESFDISKCTILVWCLRNMYKNDMKKDILCCLNLPKRDAIASMLSSNNYYFVYNGSYCGDNGSDGGVDTFTDGA